MAQKKEVIPYPQMVAALVKPANQIIHSLTRRKVNCIHLVMGISGEAGELLAGWDAGENPDIENIKEELGDLGFYLEGFRQEFNLESVITIPPENLDRCPFAQLSIATADLLDLVKKWVIYDKPMGTEEQAVVHHALGVIEGHLETIRTMFNLSREEIQEINYNKLVGNSNARYKDGYSDEAAQARRDKGDE